ncbi:MAG: hypothetical protein GXO97_04270 [Nitrospirae bacterium]|nr:hypothetical protein [Nitrospirota bacterium]
MSKWVLKGLETGVKTTVYPEKTETASGVTQGRPERLELLKDKRSVVNICPTGAFKINKNIYEIDLTRCIHCLRCLRSPEFPPAGWTGDYEWAFSVSEKTMKGPFSHCLHIRVVDGGACRACLCEISQTGAPYYNIHRLGFFITPTPRAADVLMVAGPVTDHMRFPLKEAYEAMPEPRAVVAVGTCALSGGIFGRSFASSGGVSEILPVDIAIPGCPPPPLAIIHGLLILTGRRPSLSVIDKPESRRKDK